MTKKIVLILFLIVLILAAYFLFFRGYSFRTDIKGIETPDIKMPFESGMGPLDVELFDVGVSPSFDLFSNIFINTSFGSGKEINLTKPSVSVGAPSAGTQPSASPEVCSQFEAAPSCLFVPSEYRDLCEQCKK